MTRCGCLQEESQQSEHSPGTVQNSESIVLVSDSAELTLKAFPNNKLKSGELSVCRAAFCRFEEMFLAVVGDPAKIDYQGYFWALADEIRSILAKRNNMRDKTPDLTPKKVGAFCVVDEGEANYTAHACLAYSRPNKENFWALHDTVAARGDLLLAFQARGIFKSAASPPFLQSAPAEAP